MNQIHGARNVGVDDAANILESLIEKRVAEAAARIREQRLDRSNARRRVELVDTRSRCEIDLDALHGGTRRCQRSARFVDLRLVRGNQ